MLWKLRICHRQCTFNSLLKLYVLKLLYKDNATFKHFPKKNVSEYRDVLYYTQVRSMMSMGKLLKKKWNIYEWEKWRAQRSLQFG